MAIGSAVDLVQAVGPWATLGGIIVLGLRSIANGSWVPRRTLDVLREQWEARLKENNEQHDARLKESNAREQDWRDAFKNSDAARDVADHQLAELMIYARNADRILQNLPVGKET